MKLRKSQLQDRMVQEITLAVRSASPEAVESAIRALKNGHNGNGKKKKKVSRFKGTDHWIPRDALEAICAVETPFYATLFRLCAFHGLRISEALSLRACNVEGGYLVLQRLKGSQRTCQPLLVDLSAQVASGTYRLFPIHRSTAFLHFKKAVRAVGLRPELGHPHALKHSAAHYIAEWRRESRDH